MALKPLFFTLACISFLGFGLLTGCTEQNDSQVSFKREQYSGQWLVINYWAAWCKPCIEEIPELNRFAQQANNAQVFAVNFDMLEGLELKQQSQKIGIEFVILEQDPAASLNYQRPTVLPTTLIIKPNGQIHRRLVGPQTAASLQKAMQQP